MKLASIDIGSNAVRLLLSEVIEVRGGPGFRKVEQVRVPLRLGEDSFIKGRISKEKEDRLVLAMKAFRHLIDAFDARAYRACATASMREAKNSARVIRRIRKEARLKVDVIDGSTEAGIIFSGNAGQAPDKRKTYLYIDVGGGSTELTLFSKGKCLASQSFRIGTIRLLHKKVDPGHWDRFRDWIRQRTKNLSPVIAIGSGGNVNRLYKMAGKNGKKRVGLKSLSLLAGKIESYTYEERIRILGLQPDRADVIVPAAQIVLMVMRTAGIRQLTVPHTGLADGIIHTLYGEIKAGKRKTRA
ncbi:MAG: exopolyphosphatase [Bacteroidota bacterium]